MELVRMEELRAADPGSPHDSDDENNKDKDDSTQNKTQD